MRPRRTVLHHLAALGGTTALAGCSLDRTNDSAMLLTMTAVSRDQLGQAEAKAFDELGPRARETFTAGRTDGTTVYGSKPFETGEFIDADGAYYEVQVTASGSETVERPVLFAEQVSSPNGSVGSWRGLKDGDEAAMRCAISSRTSGTGRPCVIYDGEASQFWPDLRFDYFETAGDTYYRLSTSERTVRLDRYEYAFDFVADNQSAFSDYFAREAVAVDFSRVDLSAEQRDILRTAAAEGEYVESPPPYSNAFKSLDERLYSSRSGGEMYVRFEERYYEAAIRYAVDE